MTDIQGSAEFSEDGQHRLRLDRWWAEGKRVVMLGANPSKAGAKDNDPTIHTVVRLTRPLAAGVTMLNWSTRVFTDPSHHQAWWSALTLAEKQHEQMLALMQVHDLAVGAAIRIVAWGNLVNPRHPHTMAMIDELRGHGAWPIYCFGKTLDGAPKHPLARGKSRIPDGFEPQLFLPATAAA